MLGRGARVPRMAGALHVRCTVRRFNSTDDRGRPKRNSPSSNSTTQERQARREELSNAREPVTMNMVPEPDAPRSSTITSHADTHTHSPMQLCANVECLERVYESVAQQGEHREEKTSQIIWRQQTSEYSREVDGDTSSNSHSSLCQAMRRLSTLQLVRDSYSTP